MKGLENVNKSLSNKLSQDYRNKEIPKDLKTEKPKKSKLTLYLSDSCIRKLNEISLANVLEKGKPDKSHLVEEAINDLYIKRKIQERKDS